MRSVPSPIDSALRPAAGGPSSFTLTGTYSQPRESQACSRSAIKSRVHCRTVGWLILGSVDAKNSCRRTWFAGRAGGGRQSQRAWRSGEKARLTVLILDSLDSKFKAIKVFDKL